MRAGRFLVCIIPAVTALWVGSLLSVSTVLAYATGTYGSGTYGSCTYGMACSITLTSNGTVTLNITPTASGSCTVQSGIATVFTDDANGYTLMLADSSNNTGLVNGAKTISAINGTFANPSTLAGNGWGYRVDGLGGFGAGPTGARTNAVRDSTLFAGIAAASLGGDTIAQIAVAANPAITTTVWFGVCANTSVPNGTYTTQVVYTAVAN